MRFLIDECLSRSLVEALREAGHDVRFLREEGRGKSDASILAEAVQEGRIVVSEDSDFGLLAVRDRQPAVGIVLVKSSAFEWPAPRLASHVLDVICELGENLNGHWTKIEPGRVRQRRLEQDERNNDDG